MASRTPGLDRPTRRQWWQLLGLMVAGVVFYVAHSFLRFRNFEAKGYDLGIFDQAIRQYALFKAPIVPVKGESFHLLGDHFHPILALLAPFYWVWDDPRMLGIIMALALASCAIPVYLFTRRRTTHAPALVIAGALLLWWPFQAMVNWDFHEVTLGVPIMAWLIWAIDGHRFWLAAGLAGSLLSVREDMGVTLIAIGVVLALYRAWWPAVVTTGAGALGFIFATKIAIPYYSPTGEFTYWEYTALGPDLTSSVLFMMTHPIATVGILVDHPLKIGLLLLHFVPLLFLPFVSPLTLAAAPLLLSRLFNDRLNLWAPVYQYDAIIAVIFLLAAVDGLGRILRWRRRRQQIRSASSIFAGWGILVLGAGVIGTAFFPQVFPFHRTVLAQNWAMPAQAQAFERAVQMIPDDVCVEAADNAVPHLVSHTYVGLHGVIGDDLATWMIIDTTVEELGGWDPLSPQQALDRAEELGFEVISADDEGIWVLHRDEAVDPVCSTYLHR